MQNDKKVAIIVVTYNRKEMLCECLDALLRQTYRKTSIYIIDNASTDGTEEVVSGYIDENIKYYNTGSNLGGAGGFNYGMKLAAQSDCNYVWVMDDDTIPEPDALAELINAADLVNDNFGYLCSYVKYTDGTFSQMNRQSLMVKEWIEEYDLIKDGLLRVKRATFVSFFVKKQIFYQEGLPIKEFFIWGDDTEFTLRLSSKYDCYFVAKSVVVHKTSSNVDTDWTVFINEDKDKLGRYFYNYRNWCYISRHYYHRRKELKRFCIVNYHVIFKSKSLKFKRLGILWKGYLAGLFFYPKVEFP